VRVTAVETPMRWPRRWRRSCRTPTCS
jgi:hypothetical protein